MGITFIQDFNDDKFFGTLSGTPNFISLDTETTGLDPYVNDLLTYQLKIFDEIFVFDSRKIPKEISTDLFQAIKDSGIKVILHNATFDLKFIYTKFGVLLTNVHDTMYTETMLTAGLGQVLTSLDSLVEKYCGVNVDKTERETFLTTDLVSPLTQNQINYAATDVLYLEEIYKEQIKRIKEDKLDRVYDLEMNLVPVVASMELNGITLNKDAWNKLTEQATVTTETLKRELREILLSFVSFSCNGLQLAEKLHIPVSRKRDQQALELITDSRVLKTWVNENFNLNSHLQLKTLLELAGIKVTDTNEKTLKKFGRNKIIDLLLEYREAVKKLTTYGNNIVDLINPITGKIHTHYLNIGTATGRFASNNPNMQNIPSQSEYREAFEAMDGFSLVAMDYSQQELRLVGAVSGEKKMIDAYINGIDIHTTTASLVFNKPLSEITKDERYFGKAQPLDSPILTTDGWKKMGNITLKDCVIGSDGEGKKVLGVYPQGIRPIYRVTMTDGSWAECDEEHLWCVRRTKRDNYHNLTTRQLIELGVERITPSGKLEHRFMIPLVKPIQMSEKEYSLNPYVMGALLGDGGLSGRGISFSNIDQFILNKVSSLLPEGVTLKQKVNSGCDYYIHGGLVRGRGHHNPVVKLMKDFGLMYLKSNHKFIPEVYKSGSINQRLGLLCGLFDTDGYISKSGCIIYTSTSERLVNDISEIIHSLGGMASKSFTKNDFLGHFDLLVTLPHFKLFSLPRKVNRIVKKTKYIFQRIKSIEYIGEKDAQCIKVDSPDSLYVTKDFIVTHNTLNFAILYGTTEFGLKYNLQISLDRAIEMIKAFYDGYPSLANFKSVVEEKILELGYSITPLGRRRYWQERPLFGDTFETQKYFSKMKREGFNFIIQGGGADITKIAMCNLFYNNPFGDKFRILLQVHDEIVAEIHDSILDEAIKFMKEQMLKAEQQFLGSIPAAIDFKIAKKWSK